LLQGRPQPEGPAYELADEARRFLLPGSADYVGNLVLHITNYWHTWGNLDRLVLEGRTELPFHNRYTGEAEYWSDYMAGQHDRAVAGQGHHLAQAVDLSERELLLDLGGGAGSYSIVLCEANPELRAVVIDAPEPLAIAEPLVAEAELEDRIELLAGDLFDPDLYADLPDGADAALISGVVLIKPEAACRTLFGLAHAMLDESGLMIVQDFMRLDESPRRRFLDTMMDLFVLIGFDPGSADRPGEVYEAWLADAGFVDISGIPLPTQLAVITAEKPPTVG
ncbi:MAG: methyltransferase, partial [Acidimicrobiia bacterium]|nr:methyltransferase [Acidimicrobiia bacterium]